MTPCELLPSRADLASLFTNVSRQQEASETDREEQVDDHDSPAECIQPARKLDGRRGDEGNRIVDEQVPNDCASSRGILGIPGQPGEQQGSDQSCSILSRSEGCSRSEGSSEQAQQWPGKEQQLRTEPQTDNSLDHH